MNDSPANEVSTETKPMSRTARNSRRIIIGTLAVIVLIIASAVIASKTGLDRALVRQQIDAVAAQMKERGAAQGRDVSFTYERVEIEGGFGNRHAIIHNPVIAIKPLEAEGFDKPEEPETLRIATTRMEIFPEAANLQAMRIVLPEPLHFSSIEQPDQHLLTATASEPFAVRYANEKRDGAAMARWRFTAPAETKLTYLREQVAEGAEETTPEIVPVYETISVKMDKGEGDLSMSRDHSGLGKGMLEMTNVRLSPESEPEAGLVTIDAIRSQWSNVRNDKNINTVNSSFQIGEIKAAPELLPYAPVSASMDVVYEGAIPTTQQEFASIEASESAFKLKTFTLTTKDASFNATADFVANPEDRLPVGMANVTITNLPFIVGELKKYELLSNDREQLFAVLMQQVTGTPYGEMKDVVVDVQRSRGGSFKIGKSTFEELFAVLLQASLGQGRGPAAVIAPQGGSTPVVPAPEERKAQEPIQLPEETRG